MLCCAVLCCAVIYLLSIAAVRVTIEELLGKAKVNFKDSVVKIVKDRFPLQLSNVLSSADVAGAKDLYSKALQLPSSRTSAAMTVKGITITDVCAFNESCIILYGFDANNPVALKKLGSVEEYERLKALSDSNVVHNSIVPFKLFDYKFMVMPRYTCTITELKPLDENRQLKLWSDISSALDCLHQRNFAHMDIKPENIAVSENGTYVLIDLSNCAIFGEMTDITEVFAPIEIRNCRSVTGQYPSAALFDWWMLCVTFCWMLNESVVNKQISKAKVKSILIESSVFLNASSCVAFP